MACACVCGVDFVGLGVNPKCRKTLLLESGPISIDSRTVELRICVIVKRVERQSEM